MKIELKKITIRELTDGYENNQEKGVRGFGGKLDIRPPYQREFIYKDKQRDAVIATINKNFPLNVMYWAVREDGSLEMIDGQQRSISIGDYVAGSFSFDGLFFYNLLPDQKLKFLNYELMVYFCSGNDSEKLDWFKTINIAGEKLTDQELRNAVYHGSWVSDAKKYFSKTSCPAYDLGSDYLNGAAIRQDYLETTIKWISQDNIENYMAKNQHEPNANELWLYFQAVINWVKIVFIKYRREMKGLEWGFYYNEYKDQKFDSQKTEKEVTKLMEDEDVGNKKGIYPYLLTGKEKHLNIRAFSPNHKREAYERQKGICAISKKHLAIEEMEADHITPWHEGGKTTSENCQMISREENRRKSGK